MTEKTIKEISRETELAIERIERQEQRQRKNRLYVLTSIVTALAAGSGGGAALLTNGSGAEDVKTAFAKHIVAYDVWKNSAEKDIETLLLEQRKIREALIRMQATMDAQNPHSKEVERILKSFDVETLKPKSSLPKPSDEEIQQRKAELFPQD